MNLSVRGPRRLKPLFAVLAVSAAAATALALPTSAFGRYRRPPPPSTVRAVTSVSGRERRLHRQKCSWDARRPRLARRLDPLLIGRHDEHEVGRTPALARPPASPLPGCRLRGPDQLARRRHQAADLVGTYESRLAPSGSDGRTAADPGSGTSQPLLRRAGAAREGRVSPCGVRHGP